MDMKIFVLLLLGISFLFLGCAGKKTGDVEENETTPEVNETGNNASEVADLFNISTEKPIEGEGFDIDTPSAQNNSK